MPRSLQPTLASQASVDETHAVFALKYASCRSLCSASIRSWQRATCPFLGFPHLKEMSDQIVVKRAKQVGEKDMVQAKRIQDLWGWIFVTLFFWRPHDLLSPGERVPGDRIQAISKVVSFLFHIVQSLSGGSLTIMILTFCSSLLTFTIHCYWGIKGNHLHIFLPSIDAFALQKCIDRIYVFLFVFLNPKSTTGTQISKKATLPTWTQPPLWSPQWSYFARGEPG